MTENAFYPAFLSCAWALARVLERHSAARQLVAILFVSLTCLLRPQALALLPALPTAVLFHALLASDAGGPSVLQALRRAARQYLPVLGILALALVALLVYWITDGNVGQLLGPNERHFILPDHYRLGMWQRLPERIYLHLAELDLSLGVLPFVAFLSLLGPRLRGRARDGTLNAFLAASLALTVWTVLSVSAYMAYVRQDRIAERSIFFVAPFFFIALLRWVQGQRPRSLWVGASCAVGGLLPAFLPFGVEGPETLVADSLALVALDGSSGAAIASVSLLASVIFFLRPRGLAILAPTLVLAYLLLSSVGVHRASSAQSEKHLEAGVPPGHVDWVDRAVGDDARVAILWFGGPDRLAVWMTEFFNRSVSRVHALDAPHLDRLLAEPLGIDLATGTLLDHNGSPVHFEHVLAHDSLVVEAEAVARDLPRSMNLYEVNGPLRVRTRTMGIYEDHWSKPEFSFSAVGCLPGLLLLDLFSDPTLFQLPQTVTVEVEGSTVEERILKPGDRAQLALPLPRTVSGLTRAAFTVSPSAIPAEELGTADPRRLGILSEGFLYEDSTRNALVVAQALDSEEGTAFRFDIIGSTSGTLTLHLQAHPDGEARAVIARIGATELARVQLTPGESRALVIKLPLETTGILPLVIEATPPGITWGSFLLVDGSERVRTTIEGIAPDGRTESTFRFRAYSDSPGVLTAHLALEPARPACTVVAASGTLELGRVLVPTGADVRLEISVPPDQSDAGGVEFRVLEDGDQPSHAGVLCRGLVYRPSGD